MENIENFISDAIVNIELLCKIAPVLMKVRNVILEDAVKDVGHIHPEIYAKAVLEVKTELHKQKLEF